jgi:hypothetical protein
MVGLSAYSQPNLTLVGYNNFKFDDTLLRVILHKNPPSTEYLCEWANKLIHDRDEDQQAIKELRYMDSNWISIDLRITGVRVKLINSYGGLEIT